MLKWCVLSNGLVLIIVGIAALVWLYFIPPDPPRWGESQLDPYTGMLGGTAVALLLFVLPGTGLLLQTGGVGRKHTVSLKRARRFSWLAALLFGWVVLIMLGAQMAFIQNMNVYTLRASRMFWEVLPFYAVMAMIEIGLALYVHSEVGRSASGGSNLSRAQ